MVLKRYSIPGLDGILLDLGVSSHQIDSPERGFSYLQSAPLDMRMNPAEGVPAYQLLEQSSEQELATILNDYGEIHGALRIARALKIRQLSEPIKTSSDLQAFCAEIFGTHLSMNFLARLFQSLRIAVNDELGELRRFLGKVIRYLAPSGRLAVISYHSLEDRLVKEFIRDNEKNCICPREILKCNCTNAPLLKRVTKKALKPSALETHANRRARSARLRIAERTRAAL
jgi:16S rRNA (cytosine1402-N4)-methyltransferase